MPAKEAPGGLRDAAPERPIASFSHDPRRTWPFMIMLVVLMAIGVARLAEHGLRGELPTAFVLVAVPALAFVMIGSSLRTRGAVIEATRSGLLDRRRGNSPVAWGDIREATIRRRPFVKGVRIVLCDGERYDIDLGLIAAEPEDILALIEENAEAPEGDAARTAGAG